MPLGERKVIARRAAMELMPGPVNLGIGIPQGIANAVLPRKDAATYPNSSFPRSGNIGGVPAVGVEFGAHYNAEAMIPAQLPLCPWLDGGGSPRWPLPG